MRERRASGMSLGVACTEAMWALEEWGFEGVKRTEGEGDVAGCVWGDVSLELVVHAEFLEGSMSLEEEEGERRVVMWRFPSLESLGRRSLRKGLMALLWGLAERLEDGGRLVEVVRGVPRPEDKELRKVKAS